MTNELVAQLFKLGREECLRRWLSDYAEILKRRISDTEISPKDWESANQRITEIVLYLRLPPEPSGCQCQHDLLKPDTTVIVAGPYDASCPVCKGEWHLPHPEKSAPEPAVQQADSEEYGGLCDYCGIWTSNNGDPRRCQYCERDMNAEKSAPEPIEAPCTHEWYEGRCVHCRRPSPHGPTLKSNPDLPPQCNCRISKMTPDDMVGGAAGHDAWCASQRTNSAHE